MYRSSAATSKRCVSRTSVVTTPSVSPLAISRGSRSRPRSPRGEVGPERVRPALCRAAAELGRPVALRPELGAPRPEPPRHEVQRVLVREADGPVALVRDARAEAGRL